jgi:hypothetical protein
MLLARTEPVAWVRLDDRFHANPKVRRVAGRSLRAAFLYVCSLSYAAERLSDGHVDRDFVADLIPDNMERESAVIVLVDEGLWHVDGGGWSIHDWNDYNEPRADILARRRAREEKRRERRRKFLEERKHGGSSPD